MTLTNSRSGSSAEAALQTSTANTSPVTDEVADGDEESGRPARGITLDGAVGLLYMALGFLIGSRVITDNSFLTHFATGRLIWETGSVPSVDVFSFTATGEPVTVQSWFASWLYVGLEKLGGWSLRLLNGVLGALLVASLWKLSDSAKQLLPRAFLVGAAIVVGAGLLTPRPLLFGLLGFSAVLHAVRRDIPMWTLLPMMWLWVNTHGSFPIALVVVGTIGFGQFLDDLRSGSRRLPWHEIQVFGWVVGGIALGAVNPVGWRLLWFPIHLLSRREALENVAEWSSPTFKRPYEWGFLILCALMLYGCTKMVPAWRRADSAIAGAGIFRSVVPALVFIAAGLLAYRNLPLAGIVLVSSAAPWLSQTRFAIEGELRGIVPNGIRLLAIVAVALVASMVVVQGPLDLRKYPVDEVQWLEDRELVANPDVRLINRDTVGNYLELRFGADANVFMDDRFDFYPLPVLEDHSTLIFGGDFEDILDRYDADVVLWSSSDDFADWLRDSDDWSIAYEQDELERWLIACRVSSPAAARCR